MKKVFNIIFKVVVLLVIVIPFVYWIFNPELTYMQVFMKLGWIYLFGFVFALLSGDFKTK